MRNPDIEIEKMKVKIKKELEPFIDKILSKPDEFLMEFGEEYKNYLEQSNTSLLILSKLISQGDVKVLRTSIKEQIFLLYTYLGMVESVGNWNANILIMLLIASGKDFHIESRQTPRVRHVYSLNDLECAYVPLTIKLNFLKDYGIKTYPSTIDSKLRNNIAHFKFKIEKDRVTIKGKEVWEVIYPNLRKMQDATGIIREIFTDLGKILGW